MQNLKEKCRSVEFSPAVKLEQHFDRSKRVSFSYFNIKIKLNNNNISNIDHILHTFLFKKGINSE